ncbi:NAD-dependent epimerase/dehydratase family protein [Spirillospora albida]|uniref:NAD-dependent epimerase/dehydratase family protein n=1 Tax=Spirillospora albida TaxID=58123 RepID=UPI0004BFCD53|nr:NAD-dependent epimerase/dehydratase family protein [Spirillospora albida]
MTFTVNTEFDGTTVLVTGGAGLIGSQITARLRKLGARVLVVGKLGAYPEQVYAGLFGIDPADPDTIVGDVADADLMNEVAARSDYVIHAAALADVAACTRNPMEAITANVTGTQVLLDAVAAHATRVRRMVFASSASVYGNGIHPVLGQAQQFGTGTTPVNPLSVYANTKVWGEHQMALVLGAAGVSHCVVRYFSVYGHPQVIKHGSHSWVVAWMAMRASVGLPLHLNGGGRQVRDFIHVADIAEATIRALAAPAAHDQTLDIGTGVATSIRDVADLVRLHYPDVEIVQTPMPEGDPLGGYADTRPILSALGWKPTITITEGVRRYVEWLTAHPQAVPGWLREQAARSA